MPEPPRHHDLCFGCGQANLLGLQMEAEPVPGGVEGRFFLKQDHQGPPGVAHGGVLAAALEEAMALALHAEGMHARTTRLQLELLAPAPVGTFVRVSASVVGPGFELKAEGTDEEGRVLGRATATFTLIT